MENEKFKKELCFAIIFIVIYLSLEFSTNIYPNLIFGIADSTWTLFEVIFVTAVLVILAKRKLLSYYGLNTLKTLNAKNLLFFIPMVLLPILNLVLGVNINYPPAETIFRIIGMCGVGFSEEILFRGFLFKAIQNKNAKAAIIISSVMFGCVHLANLFFGADLISTLFQIIYASAIGFMFSSFFFKTSNIIPCMICHALMNTAGLFLPEDVPVGLQLAGALSIIALSIFYGIYLLKKNFLQEFNYESR